MKSTDEVLFSLEKKCPELCRFVIVICGFLKCNCKRVRISACPSRKMAVVVNRTGSPGNDSLALAHRFLASAPRQQ